MSNVAGPRRSRFLPFREFEEGLRRIEPDPDFVLALKEGEQTTDDIVLPWDEQR